MLKISVKINTYFKRAAVRLANYVILKLSTWKVEILIIDDLFLTEFQNSDYAKYLHDILDDRINVGSTIFATQLADSGIAARVDNIGSAVADALVRRIKNCAFDIVLKPFVDPLATLKDSKNV